MRHRTFWLVLVVLAAGLQVLGRAAPQPKKREKVAPASVAPIEGTDRMRLSLLPEAARRLGIQTAIVREEPIGWRRKFPGEVISISTDYHIAIVQVELTENDAKIVRRQEPAFILPFGRGTKRLPINAVPVEDPSAVGLSGPPGILYYQTSTGNHGLAQQQLVFVELALSGGAERRKIIPYGAVLYDATGRTWVYKSPEPFVFVREPISIERITGDDVVLGDGPPGGTEVVTVGGAELYGTEFGVGK
jgi:hypothetical protein